MHGIGPFDLGDMNNNFPFNRVAKLIVEVRR